MSTGPELRHRHSRPSILRVHSLRVTSCRNTAFTSRPKADHISARLIVRRVKRLNPKTVPAGQGELFSAYRHHGVFTDSPLVMLEAEKTHRAHALVEQVIADFKGGALAHLPSSDFAANGAWLVMAAIAFNLTRAAGTIASVFHAKATTATIRRQLIAVPGRLARSARRLVIHLPKDWPWQDSWEGLFNTVCGPPTPATTLPPRPKRPNQRTQWKSRTDRRLLHAYSPKPAQNSALPHANTSVVDPGSGTASS